MVDAVEIPRTFLRERQGRWSLRGQTISGGQTGVGSFPRIRMDGGGVWQCSYSQFALRTRDEGLLWREIELRAEGGVQPLIVPLCDSFFAPANPSGGSGYGDIPHSDGALFDDDTGYYQPVAAFTISANAALRATTLVMQAATGNAAVLRAGQKFTLDHENQGPRLYGIKTLQDGGGGQFTLTISPPLREAITAGMFVEFDQLRCVMVLQDAAGMDLELSMRRFADPSVTFVEHFYPVA